MQAHGIRVVKPCFLRFTILSILSNRRWSGAHGRNALTHVERLDEYFRMFVENTPQVFVLSPTGMLTIGLRLAMHELPVIQSSILSVFFLVCTIDSPAFPSKPQSVRRWFC